MAKTDRAVAGILADVGTSVFAKSAYAKHLRSTKYLQEPKKWKDDPDAINYRRFLATCYWLYDARLLSEMAAALGKTDDAAEFAKSSDEARAYIRGRFLGSDGLLLKPMRDLQTACVFALKFGIVEGAARSATKALLLKSIADHGGCLQTGFLGTSFLMDVLASEGELETAYGLLFQHKNPSWHYSVDQGATTVWERWNSYTKKDGFGPVSMNSFNHYAYGAVLAWIYKHAAGIATDPQTSGFKKLRLAPKPDKRLGFVKTSYRSAAGLVKSEWRYDGDNWSWSFTIPEGAPADVILPWDPKPVRYPSGAFQIRH